MIKPTRGEIGTLRRQTGQGLAEYALILALIAVFVMAAVIFLGDQIDGTLSTISDNL